LVIDFGGYVTRAIIAKLSFQAFVDRGCCIASAISSKYLCKEEERRTKKEKGRKKTKEEEKKR
jgi:hypothetical protein